MSIKWGGVGSIFHFQFPHFVAFLPLPAMNDWSIINLMLKHLFSFLVQKLLPCRDRYKKILLTFSKLLKPSITENSLLLHDAMILAYLL